ncbi:MAG: hypothetical protein JSR89_01635 [Proteobacteria bacterium]|nr:hypothetical protein [Pseudomonadota bacterium]
MLFSRLTRPSVARGVPECMLVLPGCRLELLARGNVEAHLADAVQSGDLFKVARGQEAEGRRSDDDDE